MKASIDNMWANLKEYLSKMPKSSRIKLAVLVILIIVLAIVAVTMLSRTNWVTIYTAQDQIEAGNIVISLRDQGIPVRNEGLRIQVPEERAQELRVTLAAQGVLGPAGLDLSIMQGASGFAVTGEHARKLYDYQTAEIIRVGITASPRILNAIVIINSGEASPFRIATGARAATASIMLSVQGGARLTNQEAQTIAEWVKAAVPGIEYENISIADDRLNYYKVGDEEMEFDSVMHTRRMLENQLAVQIQSQVEQLLSPIFGMQNIEVLPRVTLNWDRVVRETIEFAPPIAGETEGIARSAHDLWERARRMDLAAGIPGTDENAMGTVEYPFGDPDNNEIYERTVSERNYEINQTTEVIERAQGSLEFLSIAVTINEDAVEEDYTEQVVTLITRGLGVDTRNVAVERMPFEHIDTSEQDWLEALAAARAQQERQDLIEQIIKWAVILLLGILFLLLIRMIVKTVKPPPEPEPLLVGAGIDYIADSDFEDVTDFEEVELQTKSTGLEQIERFIDKDPAAVAQLLRNWLSDE